MGADEFYTHLYCIGDATPGGSMEIKFVGIPDTYPVIIWLGSGVMDPPMSTKYGYWHLQFPILAQAGLGSMPSTQGILVLPVTLPQNLPTPLLLPLQGGVGSQLTNLCAIEVE